MSRPDPLAPRLSISGDSIRVQVMQLMTMGHGTVAPQIEALEPESWGVTWGVGISDNYSAIDIARVLLQLFGGSGRNRTGVDGFAIRCITTLPPSLGSTPFLDARRVMCRGAGLYTSVGEIGK